MRSIPASRCQRPGNGGRPRAVPRHTTLGAIKQPFENVPCREPALAYDDSRRLLMPENYLLRDRHLKCVDGEAGFDRADQPITLLTKRLRFSRSRDAFCRPRPSCDFLPERRLFFFECNVIRRG